VPDAPLRIFRLQLAAFDDAREHRTAQRGVIEVALVERKQLGDLLLDD
jgi:hypothetical protein